MIFSSPIFLFAFLPIVLLLNTLFGKKYSNVLLLAASLVFYAWGEPYRILLMLLVILVTWVTGLLLGRTEGAARKAFLFLGLVFDLGMLVVFKYAGAFAKTLNLLFHTSAFPVLKTSLPIGISFFTFQAASYLIDLYRNVTEPARDPIKAALYISFFPQLVAGPIVKYREISRQLEERQISRTDIADGFKRFLYGLGKKVLIADVLGACADAVYLAEAGSIGSLTAAGSVGGLAAWIGSLAYTFQIYYDFSGYSDMAIGLGRMFGFRIPENFTYPYLSRSITEFWRRWHITLGTWFREYVYIPLGGNEKGLLRTYLNLILVFALTGLWHGANVSFLLWGLFHGLFMVLERAGLKKYLEKSQIFSRLWTSFIVHLGWILFRTEDVRQALQMTAKLLLPWRYTDSGFPYWNYLDGRTVLIFACALLGAGLLRRLVPEKLWKKWDGSIVEAIYCALVLFLCLASIAGDTYHPFIYFQF